MKWLALKLDQWAGQPEEPAGPFPTPMKAMHEIRDGDWEPGTYIDDYFYQLKAATTAAKAPLRIACVVLITKLPPSVQSLVNDWLAEKDDM